ncbi:MAG: DedA family protein, partial [Saccharothrix sp.]|nr:DedA family protein [Saccharothrix sp.]
EFVRNNLEMILILIVFLSLIPIIIEIIKARREKKSLPAQEADDITQQFDRTDDATQQFKRID